MDSIRGSGPGARDRADRRVVLVRPLRGRAGELLRLYAGMNTALDQLCAGYAEAELELLADFLRRTAEAGRHATDELAGDRGTDQRRRTS